MNLTGNFSPTNSGGTEVRWSTGAYVTGWFGVTTQPTPSFIQVFGDHYRIADSQSEADPANWSEVYELENVASSLALNVSGAATTNNAAVIQWPFGGSANSLWTFTSTGNGYYQMVNQNSGLDAVVSHASTTNGAPIIQYSFGSAGNDQWTPLQNSDMTWTFYNLKSGKVLDDPGSSTAQGTQMDQWSSNGGNNQHWKLILQ